MALLPLLMQKRPCHCQAGIVALVTMALLPLIRDSVVALVAMALLPSSSCPHCLHPNDIVVIIDVVVFVACHQAGIVTIDAQAYLPLLQWQLLLSSQWHCCCCQCAGVSTVVELALLPLLLILKLALLQLLQWPCLLSMCRHLHCRHDCDCHPHDNGIVAVVDAKGSLPLSRWHHHPCNNGIVALDPRWHCCPCHDAIVAILKLALLPLLQSHHRHHQCLPSSLVVKLASLPSMHRHLCRCCDGNCCSCHDGVVPIADAASTPLLLVLKLALLHLS